MKNLVRNLLVVAVAVVGSMPGQARAAVYPFVDVPDRYEYNPKQGSLHDYCTKAPDSWDRADFRGPCANHDLCYMDKVAGKDACDRGLRSDMEMNCGFAFDQDGMDKNPKKFRTCLKMAAAYYGWVQKKGNY